MEKGSLVRQVESVERNIVFLRREQLTLLHGLHLEILSLQKRCAELTCEVTVKPLGRSQAEVQEEEKLLEARCEEVQGRLAEQQCSLAELHKELSHKGALVGALRASLKDKERRFLEELKRRSHRTTVLSTELQKQTEAAAYLSFQLHTARQKLHQQLQPRTRPRSERLPAAAPPPPAAAAARPKRRSHKVSAQIRAERARECVPRERVTGPEEPTAMPDPALFLHPRRYRSRARQRQQLGQGAEGGGGPEDLEESRSGLSTSTPTTAETEAE